jgi:hypothetical protein
MRLQWTLGAALLLGTLAVTDQSLAAGNQSGRLAALAARHDLCDLICYAKADGCISQAERVLIVNEAKSVLSHDEYLTFKQTLDRIAPPPKPNPKAKPKHLTKTSYVAKPTQVAKPTHVTKTPLKVQKKKPATVEKGPDLVIPAGAILPEGVSQPAFLR